MSASSRYDGNIFDLEPLEIRRLLTSASVDSSHLLQVLGTNNADSITVNKNSAGKLTVTGVSTTFTIGSGSGQVTGIVIQASGGNDTVLISSNVKTSSGAGIPATIAGNAGNDVLTGGPGNDVLSGNDGNDTLDGGTGNDLMTGGADTDTANYSNRTGALKVTLDNAANDGEVGIGEADNVQTEEVIGGAGNDTLIGSSLQDFLTGGGGADSLMGGDGNDELIGSSGLDQMYGQNGDDYLLAQNNDKDTVNGGTNTDGTVDFDAASVDSVDVGSSLHTLISNPGTTNGGSLDANYGTAGKALAELGWFSISATAIDAQGRVYFAGSADRSDGDESSLDFVVARFTAAGQLDTTFGNEGEAQVDFSPLALASDSDDTASALAIDANGNIIVAGTSQSNLGSGLAQEVMAVAKLNSSGYLDSLFGSGGIDLIDFSGQQYSGFFSFANAVAIQADGKIVVAGGYNDDSGGDFAVARLLANGSLDMAQFDPSSNFNGSGMQTIHVSGAEDYDEATAIGFQTIAGDSGAQRIVIGGNAGGALAAIARLTASGQVDTTFNGTGFTTTDFGGYNTVYGIAVNSANQIALVGTVYGGGEIIGAAPTPPGPLGLLSLHTSSTAEANDGILALYSPNGDTAPSFVDQPPVSGDYCSFNAVAFDSQGRIVVAGEDANDFVVGRYLPDLSIDNSFSSTLVHTDFSPAGSDVNLTDEAFGVFTLTNGQVIAAGTEYSGDEGYPSMVAARYLGTSAPANGEADVTEVEGFYTYDQIHQNPPDPTLETKWLSTLSTSALLYVLSQPDDHGIVRVELGNGNDTVSIYSVKTGDGTTDTAVNVNGVVMFYDPATTKQIQIYGNGGNDCITADNTVNIPLLIDGGAGNDVIAGGHANDLLFGGPGTDLIDGNDGADAIVGGDGLDALYGDGGNDIVIGGAGSDALAGGSGEDILIGGTTAYDTDTTALTALITEWSSASSNSVRVSHIANGGGLNGDYVLKTGSGATVFDDNAIDLIGNDGGRDWFFIHNTGSILHRDVVLFGTSGEQVTYV